MLQKLLSYTLIHFNLLFILANREESTNYCVPLENDVFHNNFTINISGNYIVMGKFCHCHPA